MNLDELSGGMIVIDTVHARVHAGELYDSDYVDTSWTAGEVHNFGIQTDAGTPHLRLLVVTGGDARVQLFENAEFSGGSAQAARNRNRRSTNVASMSVVLDPAVNADGTNIHDNLVAGGSGFLTVGRHADMFAEFILKPATKYLLRVTNLSASTELLGVEFQWYEQ